jgi:hypothetical protein
VAVLVAAVLGVWWAAIMADRELREELLGRARLGAHAVNLERVRALTGTEADLESPDYLWLKEHLAAARAANSNCRFVYLMGRKANLPAATNHAQTNGAVFFFVDSEPAGSEDESLPGQIFEEVSSECQRVFNTRASCVEGPVSDRWGTWVTALVPFSALPTALWFWISKMPSKLRKNTMPRRFAPRLPTLIFRNVILGGVFWTKFEHFLSKIRIPNFKIQSLGWAKRKGVGGKEFLPALAFRFQFFSAAAEFRISLCEMRRQEICLIKFILFGSITIRVIIILTTILPKLY